MWFFFALCFLAVNAQNNTDSSLKDVPESSKVEPKNISSLYIGDLLRTKPKDDLEVAGSVHRSLSSASMPYKSHGGHDYAEAGHIPIHPEGRFSVSNVVKRIGSQPPLHVKGHLLTLKPVRVVPADNVPPSRHPESYPKSAHYAGDDCSKSSDRSYSSEEKQYPPGTYRRAKQTASSSEPEYTNPEKSYYDDDRSQSYSSHGDPSSESYSSKTYPTDTSSKSESSGSYTTSKSSSTSKTSTPDRPKTTRIIPTEFSNKKSPAKIYGTSHEGKDFIVYKVREPSNKKHSSYSEKEYSQTDSEREHKAGVREPHYPQHSSGQRKSRNGKVIRYSSSAPKDRPQQYEPPHYEEDQGAYEQSSHRHDENQRYKEENKPSQNYNENKYSQHSGKEPENIAYHQSYPASPEEPSYHDAGQKSKPIHSKKQVNTQYDKPSNRGRDQTGYRPREYSTSKYEHPHEIQSAKEPKENQQRGYATYPGQYGHKADSPTPQSYDRTQPAVRPTEKHPKQYEYETPPHQTNTKPSESHSSFKRPYRESSRYTRSPGHPSVIVEERARLPAAGKEPVIMISRESKPYISKSELLSGSNYNTGSNGQLQGRYQQKRKFQDHEGRHVNNPNYQSSYKAFNSEYPANYGNDPHYVPEKHNSRPYEQPYGPTHSYNSPVNSQTLSHSEESPQQYQPEQPGPYQQGESYNQDNGNEESSEDGGRPVKKSKTHHYISKIEGYKDTYGRDEPLVINEDFFKKYGISPTAKVIVANAENPNLFVADGTNIKEGEFFGNSGPSSGPSYETKPEPGYGPDSGSNYENKPESAYGPSSVSGEENFEPGFKNDFREDSYSESPEEFEPLKQIPGSFEDLVDTNPKFLRNLPQLMKNEDVFFKMDSTEDSFRDIVFPKVGEQKGYVVSQGPREIVQQHGDGVSRIIFNVPQIESKEETANLFKKQNEEEMEERIVEAASNLIQDIIKSKA